MWRQVSTYLYYQCVLHGRITIFCLPSKQSHFEIAISCFDKFCAGNSTLTLTAVLCGPALHDTQSSVHYVYGNATWYDMRMCRLSRHKTSKRKVLLGNLQLEHILFYFHNLFQLFFELEKKSSLVTRALSTKSCTRDTDSLHSCTRLRLVQEMACLYHLCKIWPRKHSYPNLIPIADLDKRF